MQEKARVMAFENDIVQVIPLEIDACIGCSNSECKSNGSLFSVLNSRKLDIKVGSEVRIRASAKKQVSQAFRSIGLPLLFAIVAWNVTPLIFTDAGEGTQVGGVFIGLFIGALPMFWKKKGNAQELPEIIEII